MYTGGLKLTPEATEHLRAHNELASEWEKEGFPTADRRTLELWFFELAELCDYQLTH